MLIELCRLTQEVELKSIDINGEKKTVLNNSIAIKIDRENTAFIDITAWGGTAETIAKYFKKGDELLIKGEIRNKKRKIENKEINVPFVWVHKFEFTYGNKHESDPDGDVFQN